MALTIGEMTRLARAEIALLLPSDLRARMASADPALVIDVREPDEFGRAHLPGAINIPRGLLEMRADLDSPMKDARLSDRSRAIVTYCTGGIGFRSAVAAQVLARMGFTQAACLDGGMNAWKATGGTVEDGTGAGLGDVSGTHAA